MAGKEVQRVATPAAKIVRVLGARSIMIRGRDDGQIDYDDLRETLKLRRDVPPIIFVNVGTTMQGAIDDLPRIRAILKDLAITVIMTGRGT